MKLIQHIEYPLNQLTIFTIGFLLLVINSLVNAQSITRVQDLNFGILIPYGLGGTVSVLPDYSFYKTGDIILKGIPSPAVFDLFVDAGKNVQLTYIKNVTLNGDHGGSITLVINDSSPAGNGSIITSQSPTRIFFGGIMTIGPSSITPVGMYSGIIQVDITVNN